MGKKILVVDDEVGFLDLYRYLLGPMGFDVDTAENGFQGLELFSRGHYDVVILDVHLPIMNGVEVLKKIREIKPDQPVIISSSSSDQSYDLEKQSEKLGITECMCKPVEVEDITRAINKALGIKQ